MHVWTGLTGIWAVASVWLVHVIAISRVSLPTAYCFFLLHEAATSSGNSSSPIG